MWRRGSRTASAEVRPLTAASLCLVGGVAAIVGIGINIVFVHNDYLLYEYLLCCFIFMYFSISSNCVGFVKGTWSYLVEKGQPHRFPGFCVQCAFKYAGYLLGKHYESLPAPAAYIISSLKMARRTNPPSSS